MGIKTKDRGMLEEDTDELDKAVCLLEYAIHQQALTSADLAIIKLHLGDIYWKQGGLTQEAHYQAKAYRSYEEALTLNPHDNDVKYAVGILHFRYALNRLFSVKTDEDAQLVLSHASECITHYTAVKQAYVAGDFQLRQYQVFNVYQGLIVSHFITKNNELAKETAQEALRNLPEERQDQLIQNIKKITSGRLDISQL